MTEAIHQIGEEQPDLTFGRLILGSTDARSNGWYGMATLVTTEACLFAYLLFSYYYMALEYGREWLPADLPGFSLSLPMTALLFTSSALVWIGENGIRKGHRWRCVAGLSCAAVLGIGFVILEAKEWLGMGFTLSTDSYSSLFFTVTGFHMAHVIGGVLMLLTMALWTALGKFDGHRHDPISIGAFYWHFVDVVWVAVFTTIYLTPYLFI